MRTPGSKRPAAGDAASGTNQFSEENRWQLPPSQLQLAARSTSREGATALGSHTQQLTISTIELSCRIRQPNGAFDRHLNRRVTISNVVRKRFSAKRSSK